MARSSIVIDLDDPRSERIAEVMSNKSAKKILSLLAEGEMSASEIASKLEVPLNTVTYNLSKLVETGLVEKANKIFWSAKGKKIEIYRVSNRRIVISPKKIMRGILPALIVSLIVTFMIAFVQMQNYESQNQVNIDNFVDERAMKAAAPFVTEESLDSAAGTSLAQETSEGELTQEIAEISLGENEVYGVLKNAPDSWAWYLIGALTALVVVLILKILRNE